MKHDGPVSEDRLSAPRGPALGKPPPEGDRLLVPVDPEVDQEGVLPEGRERGLQRIGMIAAVRPLETVKSKAPMRHSWALPCLAAFLAASGEEAREDPLPRLIARLGSDGYEEREQAQRELEALGPEARDPLVRALSSARDLEIRARLERVLASFEPPPSPKRTPAEELVWRLRAQIRDERNPGRKRQLQAFLAKIQASQKAALPPPAPEWILMSAGEGNPLRLLGNVEIECAREAPEGEARPLRVVQKNPASETDIRSEEDIVALVRRRAPRATTEAGARALCAAALTLVRLRHPQAHVDALLPLDPETRPGEGCSDPCAWLDAAGLPLQATADGGWRLEGMRLRFGLKIHTVRVVLDKSGTLSELAAEPTGETCP